MNNAPNAKAESVEIELGNPMLLIRKLGFLLIFVGCALGAFGWFGALELNHYDWFGWAKIGQWVGGVGFAMVLLYFVGRLFGFSPKA
jgi:hypothetical protein